MITITIGDKKYKVREAHTIEERQKGLQGIDKLPSDEGMIFYFDPPQRAEMWMKGTLIPLDIIFINDDQEVIGVVKGTPGNEELHGADSVSYVVEVNEGSGVKTGDTLDFSDQFVPVMRVLAPDGSTQMDLESGERIVSRRETMILVKKAKAAYKSHNDGDYKSLGRYMFKILDRQDERKPEYVKAPDKK